MVGNTEEVSCTPFRSMRSRAFVTPTCLSSRGCIPQVAAATMTEMQRQTEQLGRIHQDLEEIDDTLKLAKKQVSCTAMGTPHSLTHRTLHCGSLVV